MLGDYNSRSGLRRRAADDDDAGVVDGDSGAVLGRADFWIKPHGNGSEQPELKGWWRGCLVIIIRGLGCVVERLMMMMLMIWAGVVDEGLETVKQGS
jgi:hypothetical protein